MTDRAIQVGPRNRTPVNRHELDHQEEMKELMKQFSDLANKMGSDRYLVPAFADALNLEHRTLQAEIVTILLKGLFEWANEAVASKRIDARNEFAIKQVLSKLGGTGDEALDSLEDVVKRVSKHSSLSCYTC